MQEGVQFVTHNLDGKARGAIALVIGGVSVVIGKVDVRWDVGSGLEVLRTGSQNQSAATDF